MSAVDQNRNTATGYLAGGFLVFLLCILTLVRDPAALDSGLVPRLLALNLVLAVVLIIGILPRVRPELDWSALPSRVVFSFAGYAGAVWLSLFFAINPSAGLLDAGRSGAALLVLCLCVVLFASCPEWRVWLARAATMAGVVCGIGAQIQCAEQAVWNSPTRAAMEGISCGMGNVNLFAGYLAMILPLCVAAAVVLQRWWRWVALASAGNLLFLILVLQCRSAWLATLASAVVFAIFIAMKPDAFGVASRARHVLAGILVSAGVAGVLFFLFAPSDNPFAFRVRAVFSDDVRFSDGGRLMIWRETLRMIADHFPFGTGAGNFTVRLQGYRGVGGLDFSVVNSNWNQPHNDFLWIFAEKGLIGFAAFAATLVFAASAGVIGVFRSVDRHAAWTTLASLAALVAYAVDSMFSFPLDRVNQQAALAVILAALASSAPVKSATRLRNGFTSWIFPFVAAMILATGIPVAVLSLFQEHHVRLAREAMERRHWNTMLKHAEAARTPLRTLDTYAVPVSFLKGFALMKKGQRDEAIEFFELADSENPNRYYILNNLAILHAERGEKAKARGLFSRLVRLFPEQPEVALNFAVFLLSQGEVDEALRLLARIPVDQIPSAIMERFQRASNAEAEQGAKMPETKDQGR